MTKPKNKCVSELRFREFNEEWTKKKLGELGHFKGGGTPDTKIEKYWKGDIPWISSSDLTEDDIHNIKIQKWINKEAVKQTATKIIPKNSILLISRVGVGKLAINKEDICTSQDFSNFLPTDANSYYLGYYLIARKNLLTAFSQGTSIKGFTTSDIKDLKVNLPSLPEQQKIASFLSDVDKKIQQLIRKKELLESYKKGVMQKLFSQEIRFKNKNGKEFPEWEKKKFHQVFERVTRKNKNDNKNVLTISAQHGLVNRLEHYINSVAAKDLSNYYLLHRNEFAYNKSYSKGYPMGAIKRLTKYDEGVVSTLYICFKAKPSHSIDFFEHYFENGKFNKQLARIAQEGARNHGLLNLSVVEFFKDLVVFVPTLEEQQQIADFLSAIDKKIDAVSQQIEKTQTFKKGLLQQMFV